VAVQVGIGNKENYVVRKINLELYPVVKAPQLK